MDQLPRLLALRPRDARRTRRRHRGQARSARTTPPDGSPRPRHELPARGRRQHPAYAPDAEVLANGVAPGTVLAVTDRAPAAHRERALSLGATVLELPSGLDGRVDLTFLLAELVALGIGSVMVEEATLITSFFKAGLVDRLAVCVAPKILGKGIEAIGDLGIRDLSRSLTLADATLEPYGVDLILSGRVEYPDGILDRGPRATR